MANNTTTFTAKFEADTKQAEKNVEDFTGAVEGSVGKLKELKAELKKTAAGSADFKRLVGEIDDLEDKLKSAKGAASDWIDTLESAGGPIGMIGAGLNKLKVATQTWGAALKATGIGLIVSAVGLLVAAFSQTEGSLKKLEPLLIGMEKIFGGLVEAVQPLLDIILDLGLKALPYVVTGVKTFYGSLAALFTLVKEGGAGVGTILKGLFTLDSDLISKGYDQIKGSVGEAGKTFDEFTANFDKGYKKRTKTQKKGDADDEEARLKREAAQKEFEKAQMQAAIELLEGQEKEQAALAVKYHEERLKYEGRTAAELLIFDEAYQKSRLDIEKKYADEAEKLRIEKGQKAYKDLQDETEGLKAEFKRQDDAKRLSDFNQIQSEIDKLTLENEALDNDYALDQQRLLKIQEDLAKQKELELSNLDLTEKEKADIIKKYSAEKIVAEKAYTKSVKDEEDARTNIQLAAARLAGQIGQIMQQMAGEDKNLAIAGILISQAAALATIAINAKNNFVADGGIKSPLAWLNLAAAGVAAISVVAAARKGIQDINAAPGPGGGGGGGGGGTAPTIQAPRVGTAETPQMAEGVGANPSTQIAQTIGNASAQPVRAYVVSQDITSQQMLDRKSNSAAVF